MATMRFLPSLQEYLKKNGVIYTVRRFFYDPKNNLVFIPGVGACKRQLIDTDGVTKEKLLPYWSQSGFKSVDDWWNKIMDINPTTSTNQLFLYKVDVIRRL